MPGPAAFETPVPEGLELPERFEVRGVIGEGGMGVVLAAHDKTLGRDVAVKFLSSRLREDPESRQRFLREARAAASLRHRNIVAVHDVDPEAGFIVMELVPGESLRDRILRDGPLSLPELHHVGDALLSALEAAHAAGIVHRDVKPSNVMLAEDGSVQLTDFGVAAFEGSGELTRPGSMIGSPAYMAPEQLRGRAEMRSDVYSAGATLFEAATGRGLHAADPPLAEPARPVLEATGDRALSDAIGRAVAERPKDRHADARSFREALGGERARVTRQRTRLATAVLAGSAVAGALLAFIVHASTFEPAVDENGADDGVRASAIPDAPVVALLPFTDNSGDPRLDFTAAGLPHLLMMELRRTPSIQVIGYYRLAAHVHPDAPYERWVETARELGSNLVVRGALEENWDGVLVEVRVEDLDGNVLASASDAVPIEDVPASVRALTSEALGRATGVDVQLGDEGSRRFDVERELQLGVADLEDHRIGHAHAHLARAAEIAPESADVRYYQAIATWWIHRPSDVITMHIDAALEAGLDPVRSGFLEGLRLFLAADYQPAIELFRELAEEHPGERDVLYGLYEALFHGGQAAEAMVVYRRAVELSPSFNLGLVHAREYYVARGDEEGMQWLRERQGSTDYTHWEARIAFASRRYDEAVRGHSEASESDELTEIRRIAALKEVVITHAVAGRMTLAAAVAQRMTNREDSALLMLGLAAARGAPEPVRARWRRTALLHVRGLGSAREAYFPWLDFLLLVLPIAEAADLRTYRAELDTTLTGDSRHDDIRTQLARVMMGGLGDDRRSVTAGLSSSMPEVADVARAFVAWSAGRHREAASRWSDAASKSNDGRFMLLEWYLAARALRELEDHDGVVRACEGVIRPYLFQWTWATTVRDCLGWSAEAHDALGNAGEAAEARARLAALSG